MHHTSSGFDEDGGPVNEQFGYHVSMKEGREECFIPDYEASIPLGSVEAAENCAQLIKDHCVKILPDHVVLNY